MTLPISLAALSLLALVSWHWVNQIPAGHDSLQHMIVTIKFALAISTDHISFSDLLREQPTRYMPLTYFIGAVISLLGNFSAAAWPFTTILFWCVATAGLIALGWRSAPGSFLAVLPLAVMISNPVTWEVITSFNLEAGLFAGTVTVLFLLLHLDHTSSRLGIGIMALVAALLALTKPVFLIPIVPGGIALCLSGSPVVRKRRLILLSTILLISGIWIFKNRGIVLGEFFVDLKNPNAMAGGIMYYPIQFLIQYRGFPLILGLAVLVMFRTLKKKATIEDLGFAIFALVPLVFFSFIGSKLPWYVLPGYVALPVWFAFDAHSMMNRAWVRYLYGTIIGIYTILALTNLCLLFAGLSPSFNEGKQIAGLPRPSPPLMLERAVVDQIAGELQSEPRLRILVDLSKSNLLAHRIKKMLLINKPGLAPSHQVVFTDFIGNDLAFFVKEVPDSTRIYTIGESWPTIDRSAYDRSVGGAPYEELIEKLVLSEGLFQKDRSIALPEGRFLTIFAHRHSEKTYSKESLLSQ